ncbi:MAG: PAS-domain containing protein [Proteobacteria bacterium]|nr:PAS-domain containing protein [Pseudomonadota bacterium]
MLLLGAAISCVILSGVMAYLRRLPDAPASFGWWSLTYAMHALRFVVRDTAPWIGPGPALFGAEALQAAAAIFLLVGAGVLVGVRVAGYVRVGAIVLVVAWAATFVFYLPDPMLLAAPLHVLAGAALWTAALILHREHRRRPELELRLVVFPFVAWGAIEVAYPLTVLNPSLAPWYILAVEAMAVLTAIGLVIGAQRRYFALSYRAQSQLAAAINNVPAEIALFDNRGRLLQGNSSYLAEFGARAEDRPEPGLQFEDLMRRFTARRNPTLADGRPVSFLSDYWARPDSRQEFDIRLDDGRWLHVLRAAMTDGSFMLVSIDISEQKAREQELIRSAPLLRTTIDGMSDGAVAFDRDRGAVAWNEQFLSALELGRGRLRANMPLAELFRLLAERGDFGKDATEATVARFVSAIENGETRIIPHTVPSGAARELRFQPVIGGGYVVFSAAA